MTQKQFFLVALIFSFIVTTGCTQKRSTPKFVYAPDMAYSPAIKAQEEGAGLLPVPGTVVRGRADVEKVPDSIEEAARVLKNPLPRTKAVLERGQNRYNIYCIVCHGPAGEGDGNVVPKYPRPPSLQTEKIRDYPDAKIFHIISKGQNIMPSYATQIEPKDRWAIVHYLRALYRSKHPTDSDLKVLEKLEKEEF